MTVKEETLYQIYISQELFIDKQVSGAEAIDIILDTSEEEILEMIFNNRNHLAPITANNIPQFSDSNDISRALETVAGLENPYITFKELGYYLCKKTANDRCRAKYGENHYKLAAQLGLATLNRPFLISDLGKEYLNSDNYRQRAMKEKLALRIPIIQAALIKAKSKSLNMSRFMLEYLAPSTVDRRATNIRELMGYIMDNGSTKTKKLVNNIFYEVLYKKQ